jgi:multicomponent Na+:H+ antiporter subunit F
MLNLLSQLTLVILAVAVIVATIRLIKGPTLPDRVVAMDLLGVVVVGFIVVLAAATDVSETLDAAMVIALIGFVATVAYAIYVERGHVE